MLGETTVHRIFKDKNRVKNITVSGLAESVHAEILVPISHGSSDTLPVTAP